jgi:hypothetical protein
MAERVRPNMAHGPFQRVVRCHGLLLCAAMPLRTAAGSTPVAAAKDEGIKPERDCPFARRVRWLVVVPTIDPKCDEHGKKEYPHAEVHRLFWHKRGPSHQNGCH